jgi:hypothetical protein
MKDKNICANCNEVIKGNLRLACACGDVFCSQECLLDYHDSKNKIKYKESIKTLKTLIKGVEEE